MPSVARGVGRNVCGSTSGSTCCDNGGRNPAPALRPAVPVSEACGVGSSRASSGSDGPPVWVRCVQVFASDAVGVGNSRNWSSNDGPPCLLAAEMPLEEPSCAVGVGSIPASAVGGTGAGPGDHLIWTVHSSQGLPSLTGLHKVPGMRVLKVDDPSPGRPRVRLVDEAGEPVGEVDDFLRLLAVRDCSPHTVRAYAHDLQKLFLFLRQAGLSAAEFGPPQAMEFLQWLRLQSSSRRAQRLELGVASGEGRVLAAKTCNRVLAAVSSFYEFLIVSEGYAGRENPIVKVADYAAARVPARFRPPLDNARRQRPIRRMLRVKTVEALPRPMPDDVYAAVLAELRTRRDRALLEVMWEGGLRPGEVLGLHLEDVSYSQRRIFVRKRNDHPAGVRQKSRRDRVVDLLEGRALPALSDYVMHERPTDAQGPWVFLVGGKGKRRCEPLGYDGMVRMFARAAQRAGVRDAWLTPHSLRHTHATRMFQGGMRELTLMARLGHATPESMKVYTRVSDPDVVKDYRQALGDDPQ